MDVFTGYRSLFLVPGTISMTHDPRYTVIGMSSELVDLVKFGRFRGLYVTVFGSGDDFNNP